MYARPLNSKKLDSTYTHVQSSPMQIWTINHGLGHPPAAIRVVDDTGSTVVGDVTDTNDNTVTITFTTPVQGRAFIS